MNLITQAEFSSKGIFDNILSDHALKFKYFYSLLDEVEVKHVDNVYAKDDGAELTLTIIPSANKYLNEIIFAINRCIDNSHLSEFMVVDISEINSTIQVAISLIDEIESEADLHED